MSDVCDTGEGNKKMRGLWTTEMNLCCAWCGLRYEFRRYDYCDKDLLSENIRRRKGRKKMKHLWVNSITPLNYYGKGR